SVINQREVGVDTRSYKAALKNTLRQAPDVILIGEIRDRETMEHALEFAETGHLAISTLHANNSNQALERIINLFPEERRPQLLMGLSQNLRAFVSQRLLPTVDGKRCAAVEVLLGTKTIQELILKSRLTEIKEIMEKSENLGMQTFDGAIFKLYMAGKVSFDDAIANADSPNNLRLRIKLATDGVATPKAESVVEAIQTQAQANSQPKVPPTSFGELSLQKMDDDDEDL
ncbi:MAG TPA: ATPase, T2SS/T4P/T4SS family, partial [Cellvibrio sp.]|nr:ATPase, T2SS/T4P/T4SS family [Cellvibrio sp.]